MSIMDARRSKLDRSWLWLHYTIVSEHNHVRARSVAREISDSQGNLFGFPVAVAVGH
jgi:hypothetical protein